VKHIYCTSNRSWSRRVRFPHSWAEGGLFQTLSEKILQLFSPRSHVQDVLWNSEPDSRRQFWHCFWSAFLVSGKCVFVQKVLKRIVQNTPRKGPVFGHMGSWFDRKKPPPGRFSIYYVPWSRAVCKRFHDVMRPSHLVVKSLTHGSWSGNIVDRKPPRGGFLSIKLLRKYQEETRYKDCRACETRIPKK